MAKVRVAIIRAPGTNCDGEAMFAFQQAGAEVSLVHVNQLIRREERLVLDVSEVKGASDARMPDLRQDLELPLEALEVLGFLDITVEDLQRDLALEIRVVRE